MPETIIVSDNLDKKDDDLTPFPRYFAECVANILTSVREEETSEQKHNAGKKFVSSVGVIFK